MRKSKRVFGKVDGCFLRGLGRRILSGWGYPFPIRRQSRKNLHPSALKPTRNHHLPRSRQKIPCMSSLPIGANRRLNSTAGPLKRRRSPPGNQTILWGELSSKRLCVRALPHEFICARGMMGDGTIDQPIMPAATRGSGAPRSGATPQFIIAARRVGYDGRHMF